MAFVLTRAVIWYECELFTLNDDIYGKVRTRHVCHMLPFAVVLIPEMAGSLCQPDAEGRALFSLAFFISLAEILT